MAAGEDSIAENRRGPLALALVMVETTDLIFVVDSIPAIFAITIDAFLVFKSWM
jgi:predicted tellurium resistance membrane protein TerC